LVESMARRARHLVAKVEDLSMRSVKGRLARLLLEQSAQGEVDSREHRGEAPVSPPTHSPSPPRPPPATRPRYRRSRNRLRR
jgi:hypothetical protein